MSQQLLVSSSIIYLFNLCITQKEKMLIANLPHVSLFSFYVRKTCTEESESDYNFETTLKCCDKVKTKQEKKKG